MKIKFLISATGNVYRDRFYDAGRSFVSYYADCAECGIETALHLGGEGGKRCASYLKRKGWRKDRQNKWHCPKCYLNAEKHFTEDNLKVKAKT